MALSKTVLAAVAAVALTGAAAFASVPAQTSACNYQFNTNLRIGAVSTDVQNLQKLLNMDAATMVSSTGAGSMGYETLRFGPATFAAVKKFQTANGIYPRSGYVGPLTRAALNTICTGNGNTTSTNTTTGNSGVVSNQIPVSVLVEGQAGAKLGEFVVSGNGAVTGIELSRTGLSNNSTLRNVYLYDGNTRLTTGSSVLTDGTIRFTSGAGLFMVNGSKTITVRADICKNGSFGCSQSTSGQTVGVSMKSVTMMGATSATPVVGVNGPLFSISSATTAGAYFTGTVNPSTSYTQALPLYINAGSMNQTLWSKSLNVSTNKVKLTGMTFKMIGSAPANTLSNVQLYVDGVSKGTASINMMNQYVFAVSPVEMQTGSHTVELRGDIVAGANRNFYMSIEEATDVMVEDLTLPGVGITVADGNSTTVLINSAAGVIQVNNGTLTVSQDTAFNNVTTLVGGATNVKLASFKFTAYGEDVKVNSLKFLPSITGTTPANTTLANVGLYVNGSQAGSNQTATHATALTFSGLGSNLYIPAGQTVIVDLRGDVMSTGNVNYTAGTFKFDIDSNTSNAQGISSSQLTSTANQGGQSLTVSSSNVTFGQTAGFASATKAPNQAGVKVGSFTIQTGSAESINVTNVKVTLAGNLISNNRVSNLTVKDGSTVVGTPIGNPTLGANNFSANLTVPMNTTKVFDVYVDINTPQTLGDTLTPTAIITYRGNTSNISADTASAGSAITTANVAVIGVGDITFKTSSFPAATFLIAGQSGVAVGSFNIKSNGIAGGVIKDVTFTGLGNVSSITANGKTASVVSGSATIYDLGVNVPADASGVDVPVTVNLVCVNSSGGCTGTSNSNVAVVWGATTYNNGSTVVGPFTPTLATSLTNLLVASKPVVTMTASNSTGLTLVGINRIGSFTVTADSAGDIKIEQIPVITQVAGSCLITNGTVELRDADGNNVISGVAAVNGGTSNFVFSTPRTITKGTSETYSVYAATTACSGNAGTQSLSLTLGAKASFLWTDVLGAVTGITGANFTSYPNVSQTKTN